MKYILKYILKYLHYSTSGLGIISHFACDITSYLLTQYLILLALSHSALSSTTSYLTPPDSTVIPGCA